MLLAVAGFYDINLLRHGLLIVGVTALAAVAGIVVHFKRTARYRAALESCVASCLHLKGASMTMSTKIIPFHRRAHSVITRAAPDAGDPRFARELARAGLPLRRAPELKGKNDEHPVH
ncbi:hypothetical protein [Devosia nitrariae]|uniref:hypothetical protein n=1 Tax=Devosia nitrariae TaxID=2071872 RepID=UPI0024E05BDC|nr:hypothetical protein [Devosia nitrariae]